MPSTSSSWTFREPSTRFSSEASPSEASKACCSPNWRSTFAAASPGISAPIAARRPGRDRRMVCSRQRHALARHQRRPRLSGARWRCRRLSARPVRRVSQQPTLSAHAWEADVVYVRDWRALVEALGTAPEARKLAVALCGYRFFSEAYFVIEKCEAAGLFGARGRAESDVISSPGIGRGAGPGTVAAGCGLWSGACCAISAFPSCFDGSNICGSIIQTGEPRDGHARGREITLSR